MRRILAILILLVSALCGNAAVVHVTQQTVAGSTTNVLSTVTAETAASYTTRTAPEKSGYVFTHWSIEPASTNVFTNRDGLGRALDAAQYRLYEDVVLTAHYLPTAQDSDADGLSDGQELYWYGSLDAVSSETDTDGDGVLFSIEMELGTNPLFADTFAPGGVVRFAGDGVLQYNPKNLQPYIIRSEPEGRLFATISNLVSAGTRITTKSYSPSTTQFAYWVQDGVRQADALGRALEQITFTVPEKAIEIVAVCEPDAGKRQALYWYGSADIAEDSDTDGDGVNFAIEMELGTNPLFADTFVAGGVECFAGDGILQYNPKNLQYYVIRSNPEGKLFTTISNLVAAGTRVTTKGYSPSTSQFAYWTQDGVRQTDAMGRALEQFTFTVPEYKTEVVAVTVEDKATRLSEYWYGHGNVAQSDDTDGDGVSFADELELGTNPHFADSFAPGFIERFTGDTLEVNLQPYEQAEGAVIDGNYVQMFTSRFAGNAGDSLTFGTFAAPAVVDWNADGLSDLLIVYKGGAVLYLNVGTKDNPEFRTEALPKTFTAAVAGMVRPIPEGDGAKGVYVSDGGGKVMYYGFESGIWTEMERSGAPAVLGGVLATLGADGRVMTNSTAALSLDLPIEGGISVTFGDTDADGTIDLLASDESGRIWNYKGLAAGSFKLQDKVWGGTCVGFAEGLAIAALDWEDDGDLDCLCGTADGKLMLLKNPKIGRPVNLAASAGADNALLTWSPNSQSRVRGYRVYRSAAGANSYESLVAPYAPLPTYRDKPARIAPYDYKVSAVSRFYTAGNSVPTEKESITTDPVRVDLGAISFTWQNAAQFVGDEVEVALSINNSMGVSAECGEIVIRYDDTLLAPTDVRTSGLTEGVKLVSTWEGDGICRVTFSGGNIASGRGRFVVFAFRAKGVGTAAVSLVSAALNAASGVSLGVVMPESSATAVISDRPAGEGSDVVPPWSLGDMNGDGRLTKEDAQILARLKQSSKPKWNERELRAGDFNGNGKLDNADYQALRERLKSLGVYGGVK